MAAIEETTYQRQTMNKVLWKFKVDGDVHFVELAHDPEGGRHGVRLNGALMTNWRQMLSGGIEYEFSVRGLECLVHIEMGIYGYDYILSVNDTVIEPRSVKLAENDTRELIKVTQEVTLRPARKAGRIPAWTWAFVAACAILPILSVGGAVPMAIATGGAYSVVSIARNETKPVDIRMFYCVGVVGFSWVLFAILMGGMDLLFSTIQ